MPKPLTPSSTILAGLLVALVVLASPVSAQAPTPSYGQSTFTKLLNALNSSGSSSIRGTIPDKATAKFKLKNLGTVHLKNDSAAGKHLDSWFNGGAKGGGFVESKSKGNNQTNPWRQFHRKRDNRTITVTLKKVGRSYVLFSWEES